MYCGVNWCCKDSRSHPCWSARLTSSSSSPQSVHPPRLPTREQDETRMLTDLLSLFCTTNFISISISSCAFCVEGRLESLLVSAAVQLQTVRVMEESHS